MNNAMKLGDTVTGIYCDVLLTGTFVAFDGSAGVIVKTDAPVEVLGMSRDEFYFDRYAKKSLKVVKAGPDLTWDDVKHLPHDCVGGQSLRSWKPSKA